MTATASLEDYIKQFKQDYKKYLVSETSSVSSVDTDELLSDVSSETSSVQSRPPAKSSAKSLSSLKKRNKKAKVSQPSHLKPLHSTPLKMIQEEDEYRESQYKLSEYMPGNQFDINDYLPRARANKSQKVKEILSNMDFESESMSVISSVDTEALLQSSDEDEPSKKGKKIAKGKSEGRIKKDQKSTVKLSEFDENMSKSNRSYKEKTVKRNFDIVKPQVISFFPRKFSIETLSLSVNCSKKGSRNEYRTVKVCTCIISGSIYTHFSDCSPVTILAKTCVA